MEELMDFGLEDYSNEDDMIYLYCKRKYNLYIFINKEKPVLTVSVSLIILKSYDINVIRIYVQR